ncbi:MAG: hypothetical protein MJE66_12880 [Proteobacteria bacterium]|nr:hypothetical protein [Pseudomonadota bacterium]
MAGEPRILASIVQGSLEAFDTLEGDLGAQVRQRLKPETLERVETTSQVAWLPVALDVELTEAFFAVAGRERAERVLRENLAASFDRPLLKPMLEGAFAIFGRSPERMLKWSSKVWSLLYRDCGQMKLVSGEAGRATLELVDLTPEIAGSRNYLRGVAAAVLGFFDMACIPDSKARLATQEADRAAFELSWSDEKPR